MGFGPGGKLPAKGIGVGGGDTDRHDLAGEVTRGREMHWLQPGRPPGHLARMPTRAGDQHGDFHARAALIEAVLLIAQQRLDFLQTLIRERFKLIGKIRVLSAEGRMSGYVLSGVPFAAAGFIYLTNPKFLSLLWTDPMGLKMLAGAAILMVIGGIWMRNIVRIRI